VKAIVDTGFDGEVCVPLDLGVTLGLELIAVAVVELADGSQKENLIFAGKVKFLKKTQDVEISLTNGEQALIGTELLAGCRLSVDFDTGNVRLKRKPAAGK
jgi:clan AA aspartic protease